MKLTDFKVLTFDCYGTLIDWETGILNELRRLFPDFVLEDEALLQAYAEVESNEQRINPGLLYPEILKNVIVKLAAKWGVQLDQNQVLQFSHSVARWPAFSDSADALAYLKQHYKLVVLSNIDHHSFHESEKKLQVTFDKVITAQDVGSYKPAVNHFLALQDYLQQQRLQTSDVLHTAQSLYHDHIPAKQLGYKTCWINRRHNKAGFGATKAPDQPITPDFITNSLAELVEKHKLAMQENE